MILMEAIKSVLGKYGSVLTAEEICRQITENNLFTKRDGSSPDPSYVLYGVKNYLDEFEVVIRLRK